MNMSLLALQHPGHNRLTDSRVRHKSSDAQEILLAVILGHNLTYTSTAKCQILDLDSYFRKRL
jgi:hypothetical protein